MRTILTIILLFASTQSVANLCTQYEKDAAKIKTIQKAVFKSAKNGFSQIAYYQKQEFKAKVKGQEKNAKKIRQTIKSLAETQVTFIETWEALDQQYALFMNSRISSCKRKTVKAKDAPDEIVQPLFDLCDENSTFNGGFCGR